MFFNNPIQGNQLPERTLSLTFDDGPGPHTRQIANLLFNNGIPATFFVLIDHAKRDPGLLLSLRDMGHLVGSHTAWHKSLILNTANAATQVAEADNYLKDLLGQEKRFVRPPFGNWNEQVAYALNKPRGLRDCVGPVGWDVDMFDWDCWESGKSARECSDRYVEKIQQLRRGIVLMHDARSDNHPDTDERVTFVALLTAELQRLNYRFVRTDAVPQVASARAAVRRIALLGPDHKSYVSAQNGGGGSLLVNGPKIQAWEEFGVIDLGLGEIALRAPNGQLMSAKNGGGGAVVADAHVIGNWERFRPHKLADGHVAFETSQAGLYLSAPLGDLPELGGNAQAIGTREVFFCIDLDAP